MAEPQFDPNAPSDPDVPAPTPTFDPNAPSEAYAPPYSDWPGIIGRTFMRAAAPLGYGDVVQEHTFAGEAPPTPSQYMSQFPPDVRYSGPLGYLQQGAATAGSPLGLPGLMLSLGGTLTGDEAHEWARQHGYSPGWQTAIGALGGLGGGALYDRAVSAGTDLLTSMLENRIASGADNVASNLRDASGALDPATTGTNIKHELGTVVQNEVGDTVSPTGPVAATSRAMKTRAAKAGTPPPLSENDQFLHSIDQAETPSQAFDLASQNPRYWRSLPMKARSALGSYAASQVKTNPNLWLRLDPAFQKQIIPDAGQRIAVTATAQQAFQRALSQPESARELTQGEKWQELARHGLSLAIHRGIPAAVGGLLAHEAHLPSPYGELAGAGLSLASPALRYAITPRGATNLLTGGVQGYMGGPP